MNKNDLQQRYSDLLERENDPAIHTLISDLDTACASFEAPKWMNWATTRTRYMEDTLAKRAPAVPRHFKPAYRLSFSMGTALVLVFTMIAISSAATVYSPQLRWALGLATPNQYQTVYDSDFTTLNQTRTVDGVEVNLQAAYADSVDITVGFSTHVTADNQLHETDALLRTSQGQMLPLSIGAFQSAEKDGTSAHADHYDATNITGSPKQLNLVLDVLINQKKTTFAFMVPFHVGKVINVGQQSTSIGVTATLEKLIVAKSGTVIFLKKTSNSGAAKGTAGVLPTVELHVPGVAKPYIQPASVTGQEIIYREHIPVNTGTWTLTLGQVIPKGDPNTPKNVKLGSWQFSFQVQ